MSTFNTIHIFGFGVVQVIGKDFNIKVPASSVQTDVDACINNVWSTKPIDNTSTQDYHAINVFNGLFCDWKSKIKEEKGFRSQYKDLDASLFEALAQAVINLPK